MLLLRELGGWLVTGGVSHLPRRFMITGRWLYDSALLGEAGRALPLSWTLPLKAVPWILNAHIRSAGRRVSHLSVHSPFSFFFFSLFLGCMYVFKCGPGSGIKFGGVLDSSISLT